MALTKSQLDIVANNVKEIKDKLEQKFKQKHQNKMTKPFTAAAARVSRYIKSSIKSIYPIQPADV